MTGGEIWAATWKLRVQYSNHYFIYLLYGLRTR